MTKTATRTEVDGEESEVVLDGRTGGPTQAELVGSQPTDAEILAKIDEAYGEKREAGTVASAATSRKNAADKDLMEWLALLHSRRSQPMLPLSADQVTAAVRARLDAAADFDSEEEA